MIDYDKILLDPYILQQKDNYNNLILQMKIPLNQKNNVTKEANLFGLKI